MSRFKIKVKVELVETDDKESTELIMSDDGSFTKIIDEKDAISIDSCEKSVLETVYPTVREAVSKHLSDVSKKKFLKSEDLRK